MTDTMQYGDDAAEEFRGSVREWITENAPPELTGVFDWRTREIPGYRVEQIVEAKRHPAHVEWERRCVEGGFVCPLWPVAAGGRGWNRVQKAIFEEELHAAGVPRIDRGMGEFLVGPTIVARGTAEQQARLLPPIISGQHRYCQGFSEPEYGSDLAGLQTRGAVDGDELVVTGQKIWTSGAVDANMIFLLCRTDPAAAKHRGLTFAVAEFGPHNGFDVRPIRQMSGAYDFAEEFISGARTPLSNVIGGLGEGWSVAMTTLGLERDFNLPTLSLDFLHEFGRMADRVRESGRNSDPVVRQTLARAWSHVAIMRMFAKRLLADEEGTADMVSSTKLFWSEYHRWVSTEDLDLDGAAGMLRPAGDGYPTTPIQDSFLAARAATIYAGTSQIQRNIIAERVLGLPR
ncbi:acyl-CoA dehydrogenase [Pseudonocardia halophobica]|uniref:Acyl-CoA dehydrogenase FadE17 n=1 Tax=Pseudonocardia halophobica TaxID=29401 RepID=A0A9W6NUS9_9PSEU|nr:acyl-CoA dehydrogenase family protein [Pseudonocardia halophobica]GLL09776.1 putative acyl-CoA dehydrogenase FadE17 [Pseudonocardia halophobica]